MSRIEELEKRLAADPNSRMFVQLAEEYRKAGMLEQAIDCCEKGLKKHPQYPSARVALGRALLEAGSFDRASAEFEAVLKQVPDNILAHKFLGETYHRLGRFDEALKKYKVASTLSPEDTELGVRIQEVQAALSGGPRPAAASPPAPPPAMNPTAPPPPPPVPQAGPAPMAAPPRPTPAAAPPPLFATVDEAEETTILVPESARPGLIDLPPIPLVEVDEPMVLETRDYIPPPRTASAPAPPPPTPSSPPAPAAFEEMEAEDLYEPTIQEPFVFSPPPAAPAVVKPPPPAARETAPPRPAPDIETPTMAEIYASQGHFDQALAVYRKLVERNPAETKYRDRIEELLMLSRAAGENLTPPGTAASPRNPVDGSDADERTIQVLEDWLEAIRRSRGT
jgi:tetratricopeptide (TPR) repeat protein